MKKLSISIIILILDLLLIRTTRCQTKSGIGIFYGTDIDSPGIQANFYYALQSFSDIELGWEFMYYLPVVNRYQFVGQSYRDKTFLYTFDVNTHYIFSKKDTFKWYAIGGFNLSLKQSRNITPNGLANKAKLHGGLNAGIGLEFPILFIRPFLEGKYIFSDLGQVVIGGGFRVELN